MGAIINSVVSAVRAKKQPIRYRTDIVPIFQGGMLSDSDVRAKLNIYSETGGYGEDVPNLFIAEVELINAGNKDLPSFQMGMTLSEGDVAAHCIVITSDRHHKATTDTRIGPAGPGTEIDFTLVPFNRKDVYKFRLYLINRSQSTPGEIHLSSPAPVVFQKVTDVSLEVSMLGVALRKGFIESLTKYLR